MDREKVSGGLKDVQRWREGEGKGGWGCGSIVRAESEESGPVKGERGSN